MQTDASTVYLDSSALVKIAVDEHEPGALRSYLNRSVEQVSCELAVVEVIRAVRRQDAEAAAFARAILAQITLIRMTRTLLDTAAVLGPSFLRSADAIHVAAALEMGELLDEVVTYDSRMADAARALGLRVVMPGRK